MDHGANVPPYALPAEKTKSTLKSSTTSGDGGSWAPLPATGRCEASGALRGAPGNASALFAARLPGGAWKSTGSAPC
jgi:hypothetical protein